jgi:hypothetical protein
MGNHPPKPAFDLSRGAIADASGWDNLAQLYRMEEQGAADHESHR